MLELLYDLITQASQMSTSTDIGTLISSSPDLHKGRPLIAGTGTSVRRIAVMYKQGAGPEEIVRRLPHLSLAQIYAALTYYHVNWDEIEKDLAEEEALYQRLVDRHSRKGHSSQS